jgi:hypothetical protein
VAFASTAVEFAASVVWFASVASEEEPPPHAANISVADTQPIMVVVFVSLVVFGTLASFKKSRTELRASLILRRFN